MSPAWSPDGRQIAYVVFEDNRSVIYVQDLSSGQRRQVSARRGVNGAPAFSPDGRKMALTLSDIDGNLDVYVIDLRSGQETRITRHPAIDTEPAWSADGTAIYFNSDRSGGPQVYMASADGGPGRRLTFQGNYNARPRVAPAGDRLAVVHNDAGNYRIATVDPGSGDVLVLTDGRLDESPSFAPNGSTVIYATRDGSRGVLATVSVDGRIRQRLASEGRDVREPVWGPLRESRLPARQRD
jgi:TolB protein